LRLEKTLEKHRFILIMCPTKRPLSAIAAAVLVAQFGQERVNAQLPLHTASMSKDPWLVQGAVRDKEGRTQVGGSFGVWVDKHRGCVSVIERMK
jgi:NTF2 fold immunity protein